MHVLNVAMVKACQKDGSGRSGMMRMLQSHHIKTGFRPNHLTSATVNPCRRGDRLRSGGAIEPAQRRDDGPPICRIVTCCRNAVRFHDPQAFA